MGYKVLITEKVDDVGPCLLKEQGYELVYGTGPDEETLIRECADCDGALTRNGKFTARVYDACPKLKVVAMHGVGVDGIDVEEATARGIQICYAGESNQNSVAEYAIGLILMLAKRTITYNSGTKGKEMNVADLFPGGERVLRQLRQVRHILRGDRFLRPAVCAEKDIPGHIPYQAAGDSRFRAGESDAFRGIGILSLLNRLCFRFLEGKASVHPVRPGRIRRIF